MLKKIFRRENILIFMAVVAGIALLARIMDLQIVKGEYYRKVADSRMYRSTAIKAPRGEITDRYGRAIVTNKAALSIMINDDFENDKEMHSVLSNLLKITAADGREYDDTLPITYKKPYKFRFDHMNISATEEEWKKNHDFADDEDADGIMKKLIKEYKISNKFDDDEKRSLVGLIYDMKERNFSSRSSFLYMNDIGLELVSKIKENSKISKAVEIMSEPVRDYPMGKIAAHILGQVGIIYKEEYDTLKDEGYGMNDMLGKDGLEKYLEHYLKGKDGLNSVEVDINGETVTLSENKEVVPGNHAILTIDSDVQRAAEETLEQSVKNLYRDGAHDVGGGAAVAIKVDTGDVLALANYPTYNPATFKEEYEELVNDIKKPMFNRAIAGAYPPGSTFKPLTAIAGLQTGNITGSTLINCNGPYQYYAPSYTPACWIYNDYRGKHGPINVEKALEVSCNIFFYETGRRVGINTLNEYGKKVGLGEKTGIELSGEVSGVLAGPEYRKKMGEEWFPGDTIQAAIGQSDNTFTPIQMANYAATIANGGTRYAPHLVKDIVSYDGTETILSVEPKVLSSLDADKGNIQLVHNGMRRVVTEGSPKNVFKDCAFSVAGKTGTAQTRKDKTPHSWFISFAPYENPQIAIAVVVENAGVNGLGKHVFEVAKNMYEAYFYGNETESTSAKNTLLN